MKRILLLIIAVISVPAWAGPTIVEAGGYTTLPKLTLGQGTFTGLAGSELKIFGTPSVAPFMYLSSQEASLDGTGSSTGLIFWANRTYGFSWVLGGHVGSGLDAKSFQLTDGNTLHINFRVPLGGNNDSRIYFEGQGVTLASDAQYMFKHTLSPLGTGVDNNIPTLMIKGDTGAANHGGDIFQAATNAGSVMAGITLAGNDYSNAVSGANAYSLLQGARLTFDGTTGSKYLSSDGTTLGLTGLNFGIAQNAKLCLDGQTCAKYLLGNGTDVNLTGLSFTSGGYIQLQSFNSLSWAGTGQGFIVSSATTGVQLNATGGGAGQAIVDGILDRSVTANTNTNAGETTLYTYSLPASTLNTNGRGVHVTASGTTANNGNAKTIRVKFGATTCLTATTSTAAVSWWVDVMCARTGAATQYCVGNALTGAVPTAVSVTTPAETLSGAVTILVTGQATTTADITNGLDQTYYAP